MRLFSFFFLCPVNIKAQDKLFVPTVFSSVKLDIARIPRISWLLYFRERAVRMQALFLSLLKRDTPILVVYGVFR